MGSNRPNLNLHWITQLQVFDPFSHYLQHIVSPKVSASAGDNGGYLAGRCYQPAILKTQIFLALVCSISSVEPMIYSQRVRMIDFNVYCPAVEIPTARRFSDFFDPPMLGITTTSFDTAIQNGFMHGASAW